MRSTSNMDFNYAALYAYICNPHLSRQKALEKMGITEKEEIVIDSVKKGIKLKDENKAELEYYYNIKGYTMDELGEKYHCSQTTILNFMKKNGINRRERGLIPKGVAI